MLVQGVRNCYKIKNTMRIVIAMFFKLIFSLPCTLFLISRLMSILCRHFQGSEFHSSFYGRVFMSFLSGLSMHLFRLGNLHFPFILLSNSYL